MLTILTPSASAAFNTIDTFSIHWLWNLGCLEYFPTFFLEIISYKLIKFTPSAKPSSRFSMLRFLCCRFAFTQFPKVSFCISIQFPVDPFTDFRRLLIFVGLTCLLNVVMFARSYSCHVLFSFDNSFIHLFIHSSKFWYLAIHFVG